jgi:hypothetical protein
MNATVESGLDPGFADATELATVCFIVGFCVGLGLAVAALTDKPADPKQIG